MNMAVAQTSREAYHSAIEGKVEKTQDQKVLDVIRKLEPCTAMQVEEATGLKKNVVTRSINNLKNGKNYDRPQIQEYFKAKCIITGFKALHYVIAKIDKDGQIKLF